MRIAYSNLACPEWSMVEVMDNAVKYGYDGVELRLLDGEVIQSNLSRETRQRIVQLAKDAGVQIIGLGASTRFAMADEQERRDNVNELIAYLEMAAEMGIPMVRTFGGSSNGSDLNQSYVKDCVDRVAQSLNAVAARAEELKVDVALETHDEFASSYLVRDALAQVRSKGIGALWDVHHPYRMDEAVDETFNNLQDRLKHVHIKDARKIEDGWQLVPLGVGEVPVREVISVLRQSGYDEWLSVEWERKWHPEIEDAHIALPQHIELLQDWLH